MTCVTFVVHFLSSFVFNKRDMSVQLVVVFVCLFVLFFVGFVGFCFCLCLFRLSFKLLSVVCLLICLAYPYYIPCFVSLTTYGLFLHQVTQYYKNFLLYLHRMRRIETNRLRSQSLNILVLNVSVPFRGWLFTSQCINLSSTDAFLVKVL